MTEFVLDDNNEESQLRNGHVLAAAHDVVRVRDATHIFHSAVFVVGAHNVIHL